MLRDDIATIVMNECFSVMIHINTRKELALAVADRILELPEIKQAERMREKVEEVSWNLNQFCKLCEDEIPVCDGCNINHALTILEEADHE